MPNRSFRLLCFQAMNGLLFSALVPQPPPLSRRQKELLLVDACGDWEESFGGGGEREETEVGTPCERPWLRLL